MGEGRPEQAWAGWAGRGHGPGQGHSGTPEWRGVKKGLPEGHRDGWGKSGTLDLGWI